jgi:ABC-type metal ion transport system substrate-binding protein
MENKDTLFIVIKGFYFDQIKAGSKKEEYRLVTEYWKKRIEGRQYSHIIFQRGYRKDSPKMKVVYNGYQKKNLKHEFFGDKGVYVYALQLGAIVPLNSK